MDGAQRSPDPAHAQRGRRARRRRRSACVRMRGGTRGADLGGSSTLGREPRGPGDGFFRQAAPRKVSPTLLLLILCSNYLLILEQIKHLINVVAFRDTNIRRSSVHYQCKLTRKYKKGVFFIK
eukprot:jgi/Antlo1/230/1512